MTQLTTFDYDQIDGKTADFLREKERNMRDIVGRAYTELGRELKEAQEALSKNRYGCFGEWCATLGFNRQQTQNLITRYELIVKNFDNRELIEDLPVSLSYEVAKPSAESTSPKRAAKQAVLSGDIRSLKEYRELVAKLEAEEKRADQLALDNDRLRIEAEEAKEEALTARTKQAAQTSPPQPRADAAAATLAERLKRYEAKYGDIDESPQPITNETEVVGSALMFSDQVQTLLLGFAHLTTFKSVFIGLPDEAYTEYRTSLDALRDFVDGMERVMSTTPRGKAVIIDIGGKAI